jgi:hypothetical protein
MSDDLDSDGVKDSEIVKHLLYTAVLDALLVVGINFAFPLRWYWLVGMGVILFVPLVFLRLKFLLFLADFSQKRRQARSDAELLSKLIKYRKLTGLESSNPQDAANISDADLDRILATEGHADAMSKLCGLVEMRIGLRMEATVVEQKFYAWSVFQRVVTTEGLGCYFKNCAVLGTILPLQLTALLEELGANGMSALLRDAMRLFPESRLPDDRERCEEVVAAVTEGQADKLEFMTGQFALACHIDGIEERLFSWVAAHKEEFIP